ncbi:MAG TPA: HtaA domain-containing protein [Pseudolysinimonas sp.]|nr:HtaA domain-containing protein [Pseudolysinimonas sp.]
MTAPLRARSRAPWLAIPLTAALLFSATPAYAEDDPAPDAPAAAARVTAAAAAVTPSFVVTPASGLADGDSVTVTVTLPATITATAGASAGSELTTGVYLMYCVDPQGARASGAQCDGSKQQSLSSAPTIYGTTVVGSVVDGAWTFSRTMPLDDAFGTHECRDAAAAPGSEQCGIFLRLYHVFTAGNVANPNVYDTFLPVTFAAPAPVPTYGITVTPVTGVADGDTVAVSATLPATITATAGPSTGSALTTGVYLMFCVDPGTSRATGAQCDGTKQQSLSSAPTIYGTTVVGDVDTEGTWTFTRTMTVADAFGAHECLTATPTGSAEQCGIFVRLYHVFNAGNVADPNVYDQFVPVTFAAPDGTGTPGGPGNPGNPSGPGPGTAKPSLSVSPSAIDPSVTTTIVIRGTGYLGAGAANGVYVSVGASSHWQPGRAPSDGGWVVSGWVQPGALSGGAFTTRLTIPAGALTAGTSYGVATFAAHQLSAVDRSLDRWAPLTVGVAGAGDGDTGGSRTAASAAPSSEGIVVSAPEVSEGGSVTATATGFTPNETGILVVVYSDPVVLDNDARADADGTVRWTGRLPVGLTGEHTLTFQGSIDAGVPIVISPRAELGCTVESASLRWGFKDSFRSYLDSAIANGEWTTTGDAGYETPEFSWVSGTGGRGDEDDRMLIAFDGAVRFTGHHGALATTIADPAIEVDDDSATLLLDVTGTTQDGRDLVRVAVPFAELDLAAAERADGDGVIEFAGIPAVLTPEGAHVFGTYAAGEQLDPLALTIPAGDCTATGASAVQAATASDEPAGIAPGWIWLAVAGLLAVIGVAAAAIRLRGRRA